MQLERHARVGRGRQDALTLRQVEDALLAEDITEARGWHIGGVTRPAVGCGQRHLVLQIGHGRDHLGDEIIHIGVRAAAELRRHGVRAQEGGRQVHGVIFI